ncbi:hypothetical protein DPX16_4975 [Anabarilius grahami]|uniref:Uncharacterized protein n=1 Tax=Anabarilius grahami TaxID=495550 RepID=A0A3N0YDW5_ANAGA|nr:hypothetical protein DPX16_4975 [Anabarilius grahami]
MRSFSLTAERGFTPKNRTGPHHIITTVTAELHPGSRTKLERFTGTSPDGRQTQVCEGPLAEGTSRFPSSSLTESRTISAGVKYVQ